MAKKLLLSMLGLFVGPLGVLITSVFYDWSVYGGLATACVVSFFTIQAIWKKPPSQSASGFSENKQKQVLREYIDVASKYTDRVLVDESVLPFRKSEIRQAILDQMRTSSTGHDILCALYCGTAKFQPSVSSRDADTSLAAVQQELSQLEQEIAFFRAQRANSSSTGEA